MDPRAREMAKIVINHSLKLTKEDTLLIRGDEFYKDYYDIIKEEAEALGAKVILELRNLEEEAALIAGSEEEVAKAGEHLLGLLDQATALVNIKPISNPEYLKSVPPEKVAHYMGTVRNDYRVKMLGEDGSEGKRWCLLMVPNKPNAEGAGMTEEEFADFVYGAIIQDWEAMRQDMQTVKDVFDNSKVRIVVPGKTDLTLSLKGRGGCVSAGDRNMPCGEVFWGPVEDSANGYITFAFPVERDGIMLENVRIEVENGKIISATATQGEEYLNVSLEKPGARFFGELGIGCNYGIHTNCCNTLLDEKMGGTIHIALGNSYKYPLDNGGGKNTSAIHWDLVCDLRKTDTNPGGELWADGKLVQKDGKWLI